MSRKGKLKRRTIIRRKNNVPIEVIKPTKSKSSFAAGKEYRYFWGHVITDIAQKLPNTSVFCWKYDHVLTLPICAVSKFVKEKTYCKKCTLFQKDKHSELLKELIVAWETDDLEDIDGS